LKKKRHLKGGVFSLEAKAQRGFEQIVSGWR
jgi:hypothetical protein